MPLPEFIKAQLKSTLDKFCDQVPLHVRDRLVMTYKFRGNTVTLFEERLTLRNEWVKIPAARIKYDEVKNKWGLDCADRNGKWHDYYKEVADSRCPKTLSGIMKELDEDPTGIFFG